MSSPAVSNAVRTPTKPAVLTSLVCSHALRPPTCTFGRLLPPSASSLVKMLPLRYTSCHSLRPRSSFSIASLISLPRHSRYSTRADAKDTFPHQHATDMTVDKARDKAIDAEAREKKRIRQKEYVLRNHDKIRAAQKAYREANKEKIAASWKTWYQDHKEHMKAYRERTKEKARANRERNKNPMLQYLANRQWFLENRERYLRTNAKLRLKYRESGVIDNYKAAWRERYHGDEQLRLASRLRCWIMGSAETRKLSWPTHQLILYDEKTTHYCPGCRHDRYIKLWWRELDADRNPAGDFNCHKCFTSDWSRALPIGHENKVFGHGPRRRSSEPTPDDKTRPESSDKPERRR